MSVTILEECLDDADAYTMLRAQGIIDESLLWSDQEIQEHLGHSVIMRRFAMETFYTISAVERCLAAGDREAKGAVAILVDRLIRPYTQKQLRKIMAYELGDESVPTIVKMEEEDVQTEDVEKPDEKQEVVASDRDAVLPTTDSVAQNEGIPKQKLNLKKIFSETLDDQQMRLILQTVAGNHDISDVMEPLLAMTKQRQLFVKTRKSGLNLGPTELMIIVLCLREGQGNLVSAEKIRSLKMANGTIDYSVSQLNSVVFRKTDDLAIKGNASNGIRLYAKGKPDEAKKHAILHAALPDKNFADVLAALTEVATEAGLFMGDAPAPDIIAPELRILLRFLHSGYDVSVDRHEWSSIGIPVDRLYEAMERLKIRLRQRRVFVEGNIDEGIMLRSTARRPLVDVEA